MCVTRVSISVVNAAGWGCGRICGNSIFIPRHEGQAGQLLVIKEEM